MYACVTYIACNLVPGFSLLPVERENLGTRLHSLHHTGHIGRYFTTHCWFTIGGFASFTFSSCSIFRLANTGRMVVFTFELRSLSCSFTISAEIWSLNGKTTRTVSSASFDDDKGRCWSQTIESTKLLMVELTRCLGYFQRGNAVFNRLHSSEKCDQQEDKRYARSSIVLSKPCLYRLSTWLWWCKNRLEFVGVTYTFYLLKRFEVLKECRNKFDCLVYEMLFIRLKPHLNVQSDSIRTKVFS